MIGKIAAASSVSLLCGLVAYAPADKLIPKLLPTEAGVKLYELSGTVLQGQAGQISARGMSAKDLHWRLQPAYLLLGKAASYVEISRSSEQLDQDNAWFRADVRYGLSGKHLQLREMKAAAGLKALQKPLNISYLPLAGTLQVTLDSLDLDLNAEPVPWPLDVSGQVELHDSQWTLGKAASLGYFAAQIHAQDDGSVQLSIDDSPEAALALRGNANLASDLNYQAQLQIKPKKDTPSNVANQMKALGRTDSQGWYPIKQQGRLPGL